MKVKELIEHLSKMNPDADVCAESEEADHFKVDCVLDLPSWNSKTVHLELTDKW